MWLEMNINIKNGKFTLVLKKERNKIKSSSDLADLLGLPKDLLTIGTYHGNCDFQTFKIYVYFIYICIFIAIKFRLAQHFYNGKPSTILNILPVRDNIFGTSVWIEYTNSLGKNLTTSTFNELSFKIKDSSGKDIDNHNMPVVLTFEIKKYFFYKLQLQ